MDESLSITEEEPDELRALDEALTELQQHYLQAAQLGKLRFFAGLTRQQAAKALGITRRAADRIWARLFSLIPSRASRFCPAGKDS